MPIAKKPKKPASKDNKRSKVLAILAAKDAGWDVDGIVWERDVPKEGWPPGSTKAINAVFKHLQVHLEKCKASSSVPAVLKLINSNSVPAIINVQKGRI